ncbi:DMT family transporter [Pasteurella multocida]|uniref:DMT family transporter n=1 Tax=Pasteurella multocida TaxID=747 RepID=UPI00294613F2|nr:DMT family transporter [Pasteurella multocida]WRK03377.1 DMT family transporter [Pasteurella multocida]HDR1501767.1 DMT family transporter [Pasteurella multocida]HDR1507558.1 DMT family transporter [Pasteurella multocida]HDR1799627.1 DMT family transporter [Pasteurella multocida]HDR1868347.1 DMT family transporter [Pasteurella multocida]
MKQQPLLGFLFAFTAACMWGSLPIALQQLLNIMDAQTVVWFRFAVAAIGLFFILKLTKRLPNWTVLRLRHWLLILLGIVGLSANFFLYNVALQYIPPTTSQVFSPLSSFGMLLVGVLLFKETFAVYQKVGLGLLILGLILFFNQRVEDFLQFGTYVKGIIICISASLAWVAYGSAQKLMLHRLTAQQVLLPIYIGCTILFLPTATISQVTHLNAMQIGCLIYCCLNTLIAYGAYAEALNHWDVTKVSAIVTQIPILTLIFSEVLLFIAPDYVMTEELNWISYIGVCFVVSGALFSATGHRILVKITNRKP